MNNRQYNLGNKIKVENVKAINFLKDANPKYAQHMYFQNRIVEAFALSAFGGVDILEQPVCGKCEKPGFWHGDKLIEGACYCPACGNITKDATSMRDYLMQELKLTVEVTQQMEEAMYKEDSHG